MPRPPSLFASIDHDINVSYGELRTSVKEMGYAPKGNTSGFVILYALGYILDFVESRLPPKIVAATLDGGSRRTPTTLQRAVPQLVKHAIENRILNIQEIVHAIEDREKFRIFADYFKATSRNP